ncbi:MAG TPA: CpsD/CapB family tyrosine-protein kinase [Dehalococcoidia bacterium]|nr:CpsD/CapB family tyrosine-protein kinase [Dehalococcoidia bacterium]
MNKLDVSYGLSTESQDGSRNRTGTKAVPAALPTVETPDSFVGNWLQFTLSSSGNSVDPGDDPRHLPRHAQAGIGEKPVLRRVDSPPRERDPAASHIPLRLDRLHVEMSQLYAALENRLPAWIENMWGSEEGEVAPAYALGITSAIAGEGKSTIALHLALHVARNTSKKVCLIDLSLSDDALSRFLGVPSPRPGLTSLLVEHGQRASALQVSGDDGPVIMLAGGPPANPSRIARSRRVCELIIAARQAFDLVLVELPAVLTGNALPLSLQMDGLVMVTRAGATPDHVVQRAIGQVSQTQMLGVVLNGVKSSSPKWLQRRFLGRQTP